MTRLARKALPVFAVLVTAALLVWLSTRPRSQAARLPDGSTLKVLGAAAGMAPFTTEKSWPRFAKKVLPLRLHGWLPASVALSCSGSSNSVTAFFEHAGPGVTPVSPYPWRAIAVVDDKAKIKSLNPPQKRLLILPWRARRIARIKRETD